MWKKYLSTLKFLHLVKHTERWSKHLLRPIRLYSSYKIIHKCVRFFHFLPFQMSTPCPLCHYQCILELLDEWVRNCHVAVQLCQMKLFKVKFNNCCPRPPFSNLSSWEKMSCFSNFCHFLCEISVIKIGKHNFHHPKGWF